MRYISFLILFVLCISGTKVRAQMHRMSLEQYFQIARKNNRMIRQVSQLVQTRDYQYQAAQLNILPKVDVLAAYNYLGDPIRVNLQTVRNGVVEGSAKQSVNTANQVYFQITGSDLPATVQNKIYQSSKNIIGGIYPKYNPELSEQQYFTAGVALRQPIYLGGKLRAGRKVAQERLQSGKLNLELTQNGVAFAITTQYLKLLYLNAMLAKQKQLVNAYRNTEDYAASMVKNEIIPPYQGHWASVALSQAKTNLETIKLEKQNATLILQDLLGIDSSLTITDTLQLASSPLLQTQSQLWQQNPGYRWLQSKTDVAKASVHVARSLSQPNIYGLANFQFFRNELPVITPPWMIGIGMQWNIFSSFENSKHIRATKSLVKESQLLAENKKRHLKLAVQIAENKLKAIKKQVKTLDKVRKEAATTTAMIRKRMKNQLSSVKDVNDALKIQLETEKAYYTAVLTYNMAVATYLKILGIPKEIVHYLK